ncbi:hypothetical protein HYZ99_00515 [Candidatus Peregrinibacteria bacterium]|nr:hypothetical protein [Candidatus Peregrinibacteria bacterium]
MSIHKMSKEELLRRLDEFSRKIPQLGAKSVDLDRYSISLESFIAEIQSAISAPLPALLQKRFKEILSWNLQDFEIRSLELRMYRQDLEKVFTLLREWIENISIEHADENLDSGQRVWRSFCDFQICLKPLAVRKNSTIYDLAAKEDKKSNRRRQGKALRMLVRFVPDEVDVLPKRFPNFRKFVTTANRGRGFSTARSQLSDANWLLTRLGSKYRISYGRTDEKIQEETPVEIKLHS